MPSASCRVQAHLKGSVASGPGTGLLQGPPPSGDLPSRPPRPPHVLEHPAPRLTRCAAKTPLPPEAAVWDPPDPPRCNSWAATAGRAGVTDPGTARTPGDRQTVAGLCLPPPWRRHPDHRTGGHAAAGFTPLPSDTSKSLRRAHAAALRLPRRGRMTGAVQATPLRASEVCTLGAWRRPTPGPEQHRARRQAGGRAAGPVQPRPCPALGSPSCPPCAPARAGPVPVTYEVRRQTEDENLAGREEPQAPRAGPARPVRLRARASPGLD